MATILEDRTQLLSAFVILDVAVRNGRFVNESLGLFHIFATKGAYVVSRMRNLFIAMHKLPCYGAAHNESLGAIYLARRYDYDEDPRSI
jgi:hypothetical protein